ncbi:hypothetical protein N7513_009597 [Penicillium frequentans]|nr:hypothetical protein N7513_009597 [Penicillium glabrum]
MHGYAKDESVCSGAESVSKLMMLPLYIQLNDRYGRLKDIRESLWNLGVEAFPPEMIERLSIDFCSLDVNTGTATDLDTLYFLPRLSFPNCRDFKSDGLEDPMISEGRNRDSGMEYDSSFINRNLYDRIMDKQERRYGWLVEE